MSPLKILTCSLLNLLLGVLCLIAFQVYTSLPTLKEDYSSIISGFKNATEEWKIYNKQLTTLLQSPQTQRSIGLFLRAGDDVNEAMKKVNTTLSNLNQLIKDTNTNLNQNVLPNANLAISGTTISIKKTIESLEAPISETNNLLKAHTQLAYDLNKNTTDIAASWVKTSETIGTSIQNIEKMIPQETVGNILRNVEYNTKRFGDIEDATYAKLIRVKNWMSRVLMEIGGWFYRVFIKP